ncbi:hypothetical protein BJX63DRAFT_426754 [Aspergillus granulosus]|uniref:Uncharacterized protein n=1 Tax=Aspergillus granulosus TaxID=176169 RepID=A0ABR4I581_9EURO
MEHLRLRRDLRESLRVPFFGLEIYDNLGFVSYPDRRGWDLDLLRSRNYGGRSALEAASFVQEWLYFGTLSEVTGIAVRGTNFIRLGNDGRPLVTSERLHFYLNRWRREAMDEEESRQKRSARRARNCLEFVIQCTYTTDSLLVPEHPEVAISIEMLLISLLRTFTAIYGRQSWDAAPSIFDAPKWTPGTNRQVILHLKTQMASQGWCRHRLESFGQSLLSDSLYIISLLGTDDLLEGHASCTQSMCIGNQIDDSTYNDTPRHVLQGCPCDFVHVDLSKAVEIIERGHIPLATVSISRDNQLRLDVRPYEPGMSYIAISHV